MASTTVRKCFICHFCFDEYPNRSSLVSHFSQCSTKNRTKRNEDTNPLPRLSKTDRDLLQMLKLNRSNQKKPHPSKSKRTMNSHLQIPLTISSTYSLKQASYDNPTCINRFDSAVISNGQFKEKPVLNTFTTKSSVYHHTYKFSRREQKHFYASVKRARLKRQYTNSKKSHTGSAQFNKDNFFISLPTKISLRQRLNTNSNNSFPLIFDPNFHTLVQLSNNNTFRNYSSDIKHCFQLIHSIASQEFQIMINSNDNQHRVSYTAFSFINVLRQTMTDYTINIQKNLKRNYFQSFQHDDQQLAIPYKIPRSDQSTSSPSSTLLLSTSSSIQITTNCHHFETQSDNNVPSPSTINNFVPAENNAVKHVVLNPVHSEPHLTSPQSRTIRTNTQLIQNSCASIADEHKVSRSPSPILLKKQKIESVQNDSCQFPIEKARIRIINGQSETRKRTTSTKTIPKLSNPVDENSMVKSARMITRKSPIKTENVTEINPSFETKPVILSANEISEEWSKHNVFYRCHACSHEEFFGVLSRECINLHISSKHGNMEDNFKHRQSNFLNNKGRSLKIFQHYLKWQQPWPEKEIEKFFKYSNK